MGKSTYITYGRNIIAILLVAVTFLSCKTDIEEINRIRSRDDLPEMYGENMQMWYSDSARIKYYFAATEYSEYMENGKKVQIFPRGIYALLYDEKEEEVGSIVAQYAKFLESDNLWEARNEVILLNSDGKKLETDLLYWNMSTERIYTDRYARLTSGGQILEGHKGFESDQHLTAPLFKSVTGEVEVEN